MTLTILFRDETRVVECDSSTVEDGLLYVFGDVSEHRREVKQIWNMKNIIGVEMENE